MEAKLLNRLDRLEMAESRERRPEARNKSLPMEFANFEVVPLPAQYSRGLNAERNALCVLTGIWRNLDI